MLNVANTVSHSDTNTQWYIIIYKYMYIDTHTKYMLQSTYNIQLAS
jgi:hypothetical protein